MPGPIANLASLHDVELCSHAAVGERRAFGELARRHGSAVRYLLRRMGAQPAEADDVAQDAFLAAFERITEFRGEGTFAGWVKKIAARLYLRRIQKERRVGHLELDGTEEDLAASEHAGHADRRIDLDEALKVLGPAERLCVSMCYGAGLSHVEAAEALNLPLGTVKSHVKRGLDKLRARLAPPEGVVSEGDWAMAEADFERRLERLFAEAPELPDCAIFAQGIEGELNRGWATRPLADRLGRGDRRRRGRQPAVRVERLPARGKRRTFRPCPLSRVSRMTSSTDMVSALSGGFGLWTALGLAVVTMGFALTRVLQEI